MEKKKLTSANGRLIADNQNTQTAGQRTPVLPSSAKLVRRRSVSCVSPP